MEIYDDVIKEVQRNTIFCVCGKSIHDHPADEDGQITRFGWACPFLPKGYIGAKEPLSNYGNDDMAMGGTLGL